MAKGRYQSGFTLIEFSVVLIVTGVMTVAAVNAYDVHRKGQYARTTYSKMDNVNKNLEAFFASQGRYPCPAPPVLISAAGVPNPNAGLEDCTTVAALALGTCDVASGLCRAGGRDTPFNGIGADPIDVGALPYKTILTVVGSVAAPKGEKPDSLALTETLDAWSNQLTYAVTEQMTVKRNFPSTPGAIKVVTETDRDLVNDPPGSAFWVVTSHGSNSVGAYTTAGKQRHPCTVGSTNTASVVDTENCNNPGAAANVAIKAANKKFVSGVRMSKVDNTYFDDIVVVSTNKIKGLWTAAQDNALAGSTSANDIVNKNLGNVGINVVTPMEKLDIGGDIKAAQAHVTQVCDTTGNKCFNPEKLGGPGGMVCASQVGDPPNTIRVMTGIANSLPVCSAPLGPPTSVVAAKCPPGNPLLGVTSTGCTICTIGLIMPGCLCSPGYNIR